MRQEFSDRISKIGTPPKAWNFFRNNDADLQALIDNGPFDSAGGRGGRDDEITDRMVSDTLWRVRWERRLRIYALIKHAVKRRVLSWYGALKERISNAITRIAAKEEAAINEEMASAGQDGQ